MALNLWSTSPASNDMVNYFQTGMRPSSVKTAGWNVMADLAQLFNAIPAGAGTANAQTLANPRPFTALTTGLTVIYNPTVANTGPATFIPDGLTAKNIFAAGIALVGGELQANVPAWMKYDGTQWNLLNPIRSIGSIYGAITGTSALTMTVGTLAAYYDGLKVRGKMASTTTGTPSLNVNSIGAKNVYYADLTTQLVASANIANGIYEFIYDSSLNSGAGGWICTNPSTVNGSFTITFSTSYFTVQQTGTVKYSILPDGRTVYIHLDSNISGTSNSASLIGTGIPNAIAPATAKVIGWFVKDSGGLNMGSINTGTSTSWSLGNNTTGSFSTSGVKGMQIYENSYTLD